MLRDIIKKQWIFPMKKIVTCSCYKINLVEIPKYAIFGISFYQYKLRPRLEYYVFFFIKKTLVVFAQKCNQTMKYKNLAPNVWNSNIGSRLKRKGIVLCNKLIARHIRCSVSLRCKKENRTQPQHRERTEREVGLLCSLPRMTIAVASIFLPS